MRDPIIPYAKDFPNFGYCPPFGIVSVLTVLAHSTGDHLSLAYLPC